MSIPPQPSRRVLLVGDGSLLVEGVQSLLMAELSLEVSDIITYTDETALKQTFLRVQPDAVVLKETPALDLARFLALLRDVPLETTLRVIVISSDKSALDVYEKQRVLPKQGRDFVALVRGEPTVSNSSDFS